MPKSRLAILAILIPMPAFAEDVSRAPVKGDQVTPTYQHGDGRLPGDNVVPNIDLGKNSQVQDILRKAEAEYREMAEKINAGTVPPPIGASVSEHPAPQGIEVTPSEETQGKTVTVTKRKNPARSNSVKEPAVVAPRIEAQPRFSFTGEAKVFSENLPLKSLATQDTVTLPSNSAAMATLEAGVKVRLGSEMRMPVRLDYAFLGPNNAVVEMTGCNAWISVSPDPSTSRICGDKGTISCRANNGQTFNLDFRLQIVDQADNYTCMDAQIVLNGKGEAALAGFGEGAVNAFGTAMAAAQVSTQVQTSPEGNVGVTGANVTGDKNKYIAGQTLAGASANWLNWYVEFQKSRQPSLDAPSGKKIYLTIDGEVPIPRIFFQESTDPDARKLNTNISLMKKETKVN